MENNTSIRALALLIALSVSPMALAAGAAITPAVQEKMDEDAPPKDKKPGKTTENLSLGSYLAGRLAESTGDTQNGIKFLRESLARDPGNKEMLSSLYRMLILSGKIEEAMSLAGKLAGTKVVEEGSEFSPEMLLAISAVKEGKFAEADKYLQSISRIGYNSLLVPMLLHWTELGQEKLKAPVDAKDIMLDGHTVLPHVYLNAAFINDIAGFDAEARKQYEAAVKDARVEPFRAVEALSNYYARKGLTEKREALVNAYIKAHGDSFLAYELLAAPLGDHPRPLVTNATEGFAEVFYSIANIFHGVRAPADEIAILHLALYLRSDYPPAQFLLAGAYELGQSYPQAIATYKGINRKSAYFVRGRIRSLYDESEKGDRKAALKELDAIAAEKPKDLDALLAKGDILREENHFREAVEAYGSAIARIETPKKHHWIVYFSRGACYERMGQWEKAEVDMKQALSLNPSEPEILNYLGYSWLTMRTHIPEAKKMIEDAYDARPEDAHIIDSMGYSLYVNGDFASAQEYFEQALEHTPNDPTVNDHLGDAYWQLGRKTEARYQWERALSDNPDDETKRGLHEKLEKGLALFHPLAAVQEKKPASPHADE